MQMPNHRYAILYSPKYVVVRLIQCITSSSSRPTSNPGSPAPSIVSIGVSHVIIMLPSIAHPN